MKKQQPLLTRKQVAQALGVQPRTIPRLEKRGVLPRIQLSYKLIRYRQEDVDDLIARRIIHQMV